MCIICVRSISIRVIYMYSYVSYVTTGRLVDSGVFVCIIRIGAWYIHTITYIRTCLFVFVVVSSIYQVPVLYVLVSALSGSVK